MRSIISPTNSCTLKSLCSQFIRGHITRIMTITVTIHHNNNKKISIAYCYSACLRPNGCNVVSPTLCHACKCTLSLICFLVPCEVCVGLAALLISLCGPALCVAHFFLISRGLLTFFAIIFSGIC